MASIVYGNYSSSICRQCLVCSRHIKSNFMFLTSQFVCKQSTYTFELMRTCKKFAQTIPYIYRVLFVMSFRIYWFLFANECSNLNETKWLGKMNHTGNFVGILVLYSSELNCGTNTRIEINRYLKRKIYCTFYITWSI